MRFEISILILGALATLLLAVAAVQGYAVTADELPLHLLISLPAAMGAALPHVWTALYLLGTRRGLGREPDVEDDLVAARALGRRALVPVLAALVAIVALMLTGARAYTGGGEPVLHGVLFWALLVTQPVALAVEWRLLSANHRLLARHGG